MPEDTVAQIKFWKNGNLTQEIDGTKTVIATFDRKTSHLEFETQDYANRLIRQVTSAIGTVDKGTKPSGLSISTMGVKGMERDQPSGKVPPKPKRDPKYGDQTEDLVKWYFKYYPHEAYIRYGVFLDENGEPVRHKVKRRLTETIDDRDGTYGLEDQNEGKGAQVGPKRWEKGPIGQVVTQEILEDQIIARRATCMTYAPVEVVGGFDSGDEEIDHGVREEGEE